MQHWMRNIPSVDESFIASYIVPLEALYAERKALNKKITDLEIHALLAATSRWPDALVYFHAGNGQRRPHVTRQFSSP